MEPPHAAGRATEERRRNRGVFSWMLAAVLLIITGCSGLEAYRSKDDAATLASVTNSFRLGLVLLFCCLWLKERVAPGSAWRDRLKAFVWALTTLFFFYVAYMVMGAAALTLRVAVLVWFIAAAAGAGFFYAFFNRRARVNQSLEEITISIV